MITLVKLVDMGMLQPNSSHFVPMTLDSDIEWSGVGAILIGSPTRVRQ